jgi:hypothetical protein
MFSKLRLPLPQGLLCGLARLVRGLEGVRLFGGNGWRIAGN